MNEADTVVAPPTRAALGSKSKDVLRATDGSGFETGQGHQPTHTDLPWFELELPRPPSVNRFMAKLGNKSPVVRTWIKRADAWLTYTYPPGKPYPKLKCEYELSITFPILEFGKFDPDNLIKPLSDWLQRVEVIANDRFARRLKVDFDDVAIGYCRVRVRPWMECS